MKIIDNELDEVQTLVRDALKVSQTDCYLINQIAFLTHVQVIAKYNIISWDRQAPTPLRKALKDYHSLINAPSIGCEENYTHYSYQLNVARPQHISKGL